MKMLLNEFLELNLSDLIAINGGASGSYSGSGSTKPDHYSAETGWESGWGPSGYTGSTKPDHYSAETGWEPGWGPEGYTGTPTAGTCGGSTKSDPVPSNPTPKEGDNSVPENWKPSDTTMDGGHVNFLGQNLTNEEIAFVVCNPLDALAIKDNSDQALNLYNGHNDITDAKRHALWSAMNARDVGMNDAITYGYAHEDYAGNVDYQMDMYNNRIGWEIARKNPYASDSELVLLIEQAADGGRLVTK